MPALSSASAISSAMLKRNLATFCWSGVERPDQDVEEGLVQDRQRLVQEVDELLRHDVQRLHPGEDRLQDAVEERADVDVDVREIDGRRGDVAGEAR